jgi:hypothetical protein
MPTASTPAVIVGSVATLVTAPTNMKVKPTAITIDNQDTADHTIYFRDSFTPDPYDGSASPSPVLPARGQYTVPKGVTMIIDKNALMGREFLGAMQCYADSASPACIITVDFQLE